MFGSIRIHRYINININTIMKKPEMLNIVPDHLKTKICANMQLKNYLIY